MPWDRKFSYPVPGFPTYKDAADHIMSLPKKDQEQPHWQFATQVLIKAADRDGGWTMFAHMAMLRALNQPKLGHKQRR